MLGMFNFDDRFVNAFNESISQTFTLDIYDPLKETSNLDGYFINLLPKDHPSKDVVKNQIALIEKAKQDKKKLYIFDSRLSLTDKEMKWLRNSSIIFEPALHNNDRAIYLPHWLDINLDYSPFEHETEYDIGFFGDGSLEGNLADDIFFNSAKNLDLKFVTISDCIISKDVERKCKECGIEIVDDIVPVNFVILLPSKFHLSVGYFPDTQVYIDNKFGIMFPGDMIYYRFTPQVWNKDDVRYWYKKKVKDAILLQYKIEVDRFYPRMLLKNVIKKIKEYV